VIKEEVLQSFNKKNCLITGGMGLIGRPIVKMLCDADARVRIVSIDKVFAFELYFLMICWDGFEAML
jgi:GDP-L-fucose synthase